MFTHDADECFLGINLDSIANFLEGERAVMHARMLCDDAPCSGINFRLDDERFGFGDNRMINLCGQVPALATEHRTFYDEAVRHRCLTPVYQLQKLYHPKKKARAGAGLWKKDRVVVPQWYSSAKAYRAGMQTNCSRLRCLTCRDFDTLAKDLGFKPSRHLVHLYWYYCLTAIRNRIYSSSSQTAVHQGMTFRPQEKCSTLGI